MTLVLLINGNRFVKKDSHFGAFQVTLKLFSKTRNMELILSLELYHKFYRKVVLLSLRLSFFWIPGFSIL
jgi:hypothetical protein